MPENSQVVPQGFQTVTPYLVLDDASAAVEFYRRAFDAEETFRVNRNDGRAAHVEIRIGDSPVMLAEGVSDYPFMRTAGQFGGSPVQIYLYLPDAARTFEQAIEAGAEVVMPVELHDDGDRRGGIRDPFGIIWWLATATDHGARERLNQHQAAG